MENAGHLKAASEQGDRRSGERDPPDSPGGLQACALIHCRGRAANRQLCGLESRSARSATGRKRRRAYPLAPCCLAPGDGERRSAVAKGSFATPSGRSAPPIEVLNEPYGPRAARPSASRSQTSRRRRSVQCRSRPQAGARLSRNSCRQRPVPKYSSRNSTTDRGDEFSEAVIHRPPMQSGVKDGPCVCWSRAQLALPTQTRSTSRRVRCPEAAIRLRTQSKLRASPPFSGSWMFSGPATKIASRSSADPQGRLRFLHPVRARRRLQMSRAGGV